jgi:hypothetical protein
MNLKHRAKSVETVGHGPRPCLYWYPDGHRGTLLVSTLCFKIWSLVPGI